MRTAPLAGPLAAYAALRLAQMASTRVSSRARDGARSSRPTPRPRQVRAAARVLGGEAAYWARDYAQAAALYGGFLSSYPDQPQAPR